MYKRILMFSMSCLLAATCSFSQISFAEKQTPFNYAEALQKGIYFYEAQQSGVLPDWNRVEWRGPSGLTDGVDNGVDLTGGWYDAGDHVKFNFPMAASVTMLAWGAIEYRAGYENSQQLDVFLRNIKFVTDYFIKCHVIENGKTSRLYAQVGKGGTDHSFWGSPEVMKMERPSYYLSADGKYGSDLAGETAAALAAASIVFRPTNPTYANTLLEHAKLLYGFADQYRGSYSDAVAESSPYYYSYNGYLDELAWGAVWLYQALRAVDSSQADPYLTKAKDFYRQYLALLGTTTEHREYKWTVNWNDKYFGTSVLLAKLTGEAVYREKAEKNLNWWSTGIGSGTGADNRIPYTSSGKLAYLDVWGPLRYASNAAFLAFVYGDWVSDPALKARYLNFAKSQIDYMLGDNPRHSSYLIGFGNNTPKNPHHRSSHGSWVAVINIPVNNRHILYGALVGGPKSDDSYSDDREDYKLNEVACDYNAAFLGNLAKLCSLNSTLTPLNNFPTPEVRDDDELYVEAKINSEGNWGFQPLVKVVNKTGWYPRPKSNLLFRYFFTLESGQSIDKITVRGNGGESDKAVKGPFLWAKNIYYVDVDLKGITISPSSHQDYSKDIYFTISDSSGSWDSSNDWSYQGLTSSMQKTKQIALYDNGVLIWGTESPTTVPDPEPPKPLHCNVNFAISNQWNSGYVANVTITNTGTKPVKSWLLKWNFTGDQRVSSSWNSKFTQAGQTVTITPDGNRSIPVNSSVSFGLQATYNGTLVIPSSFEILGYD